MAESLRDKTISGMLWSSVGKSGTMVLNFISNLVLARLLMPSDYGAISMLHVFIAVSSIFVSAGFATALIQKKNPSHIDYTSVFYWNTVAAIIIYGILFLSGPSIARFYNIPELCPVLRVQSLSLIVQAFSTVQSNQLQKQLRFKELSSRNLISALIGTIVAIGMAFFGYGVWSLVVSNLVASFASVLLLWRMSTWRPTWEFSWKSLKELFGFGGLMALSSFVETVYGNIMSLILGKYYSPSTLGYYTQARKLERIPSEALSSVVGAVSFPVFSSLQDDKEKLLWGLRKNIKSLMFINVPLMMLLVVIGRPLIVLLYGMKWEISIVYFQILCFGGMVFSLNNLNVNVIKSLGKGKIFITAQLVKRGLSLLMIFGSIIIGKYGIMDGVLALVIAFTLTFYTNIPINAFINKRLIGYGLIRQICDIAEYFIIGGIVALITWGLSAFLGTWNQYVVMIIQIIVYVIIYLIICAIFKIEGFLTYYEIVRSKLLGKLKR